jgi:hypothetical protein
VSWCSGDEDEEALPVGIPGRQCLDCERLRHNQRGHVRGTSEALRDSTEQWLRKRNGAGGREHVYRLAGRRSALSSFHGQDCVRSEGATFRVLTWAGMLGMKVR